MDDVETEMAPLQSGSDKTTPTHVVGSSTSRGRHRHDMARPRHRMARCLSSNLLTTLTVLGVLSGVAVGFIMRAARSTPWTPREVMYVQFVGDLFLRMLKALIIPLLISSIVAAIGALDLSLSYKIGARAIVYYLTTTVLAVIEGIILVVVVHPGRAEEGVDKIKREGTSRNVTTVDTLLDLVRNIFPPNLIQATVSQYRTVLIPPKPGPGVSNETMKNMLEWQMKGEFTDGTNVLGLVAFAVILGIAIGKMGERGKPLLQFFECLGTAMMNITNWVIWVSPIGVLFLVASKLLEMADFGVLIGQLGKYFMTVLLGLFIHGFVLLPILYTLVTRKLPFRFLVNMGQALATAFGTASSSATLPVSMNCLEEHNGVDMRVSRFVMPIGATINMDGTALYEAVAAIFIAQARGISLGFGHIVAVSITATFASIGAAGIPQAGLVTMVMVLDTVGLPAEDVTLIIAVDWLLDRFRTLVNVVGDSLGAGIVNHLSQVELEKMTRMQHIQASSPGNPGNGKSDGNVAEVHL